MNNLVKFIDRYSKESRKQAKNKGHDVSLNYKSVNAEEKSRIRSVSVCDMTDSTIKPVQNMGSSFLKKSILLTKLNKFSSKKYTNCSWMSSGNDKQPPQVDVCESILKEFYKILEEAIKAK